MVYIVTSTKGSYDDIYTKIEKIFSDKNKAEIYIKEQNEIWSELKKQSDKCWNCPYHYAVDYKKIKDKELFVSRAKKICDKFDIDLKNLQINCCVQIYEDDVLSFQIEKK